MAKVWRFASGVVSRTVWQNVSVTLPADVPRANMRSNQWSVPFIFQYVVGKSHSKLMTGTAVSFTAEMLQTCPSAIFTVKEQYLLQSQRYRL